MTALNMKNIPTGAGDDIKVDVSYAKDNTIATSSTSPSFAMFGSSGCAYQSIGFGATTDGVYLPGMTRRVARQSLKDGRHARNLCQIRAGGRSS
jgi:hypothetical protein